MVIKHLFLLVLFMPFNLFGCEKDTINKIVFYTLPMDAMYYSSMDERLLMKESDKKTYSLSVKEVLSLFNDICNKIDVDSLFNPKFQRLDLKVLMEIHFNKAGIFKIGLNNCGDYILLDEKRVFYRNEELVKLIESNVPPIKFDKCIYQNR